MLIRFSLSTHKAIECGDVSVVKRWLQEKETNVNEHRGGRASHGHFFVSNGTALHWAAYYGKLEIAKLLLSKNAGMYDKFFSCMLVNIQPVSISIVIWYSIYIFHRT